MLLNFDALEAIGPDFDPSSEEVEYQTQKFLRKGGTITVLPSHEDDSVAKVGLTHSQPWGDFKQVILNIMK